MQVWLCAVPGKEKLCDCCIDGPCYQIHKKSRSSAQPHGRDMTGQDGSGSQDMSKGLHHMSLTLPAEALDSFVITLKQWSGQHSTAQHSTAQHSTALRSTAQRSNTAAQGIRLHSTHLQGNDLPRASNLLHCSVDASGGFDSFIVTSILQGCCIGMLSQPPHCTALQLGPGRFFCCRLANGRHCRTCRQQLLVRKEQSPAALAGSVSQQLLLCCSLAQAAPSAAALPMLVTVAPADNSCW